MSCFHVVVKINIRLVRSTMGDQINTIDEMVSIIHHVCNS